MAERHLSIDLETLGTAPGSQIVSVGAVVFEPHTGSILARRQANLDLQPQTGLLAVDLATVEWWAKQDPEAWRLNRVDLEEPAAALVSIAGLYRAWHCCGAWGHGAGFDVTLLESAMRAFDIAPPWRFHDVRDTRTLFAASGVRVDRSNGLHHLAVADAEAQALAVAKAYRALGLSGSAPRRWLARRLRESA